MKAANSTERVKFERHGVVFRSTSRMVNEFEIKWQRPCLRQPVIYVQIDDKSRNWISPAGGAISALMNDLQCMESDNVGGPLRTNSAAVVTVIAVRDSSWQVGAAW